MSRDGIFCRTVVGVGLCLHHGPLASYTAAQRIRMQVGVILRSMLFRSTRNMRDVPMSRFAPTCVQLMFLVLQRTSTHINRSGFLFIALRSVPKICSVIVSLPCAKRDYLAARTFKRHLPSAVSFFCLPFVRFCTLFHFTCSAGHSANCLRK